MKVALTHLHPNPFRDLVRLPTKPPKVDALKRSIKETTFWDNLVARKAPNGGSGYQIAYGHNRLEALRQLKIDHIDIAVRDLTDEIMLKMMANENMEEWGATSDIEQETVRAVVTAFAEDQIELPKVVVRDGIARKGVIQFYIAPSFKVVTKNSATAPLDHLYTSDTVAAFIGWPAWKVGYALNCLAAIEEGFAKDADFAGMTATQAATVVREVKRVATETRDKAFAVKVGKELSAGMRMTTGRHGKNPREAVTTMTAKYRADEIMRTARVKRYVEERKTKAEKFELQKQNRQVKEFLDACKFYQMAVQRAGGAISKFSPEARAFTVRRLHRLADDVMQLSGRMK